MGEDDAEHRPAVSIAIRGCFTRSLESLRGVLANGFQEPVTRRAATDIDLDHRTVDELAQQVDYRGRFDATSATHLLSRRKRPATAERRESAQDRLLIGCQQVMTPIERRAHR